MENFTPPSSYTSLLKSGSIEIDDAEPTEWHDVIWLPLTSAEDYHEEPSEYLPRCCDNPGSIIVFAKACDGYPWCWDTQISEDGDYEVCQIASSWDVPYAPSFTWFLLRQFVLMLDEKRGFGGEARIQQHYKILESILSAEQMTIATQMLSGTRDSRQYAEFVHAYLPARYHNGIA